MQNLNFQIRNVYVRVPIYTTCRWCRFRDASQRVSRRRGYTHTTNQHVRERLEFRRLRPGGGFALSDYLARNRRRIECNCVGKCVQLWTARWWSSLVWRTWYSYEQIVWQIVGNFIMSYNTLSTSRCLKNNFTSYSASGSAQFVNVNSINVEHIRSDVLSKIDQDILYLSSWGF